MVTWNKRIQYALMEIVADNREKKWIDYFVPGKEIWERDKDLNWPYE